MALSILIFLLSFTSLSGAFAQEILPTPTPQINYELPYPGLLPDNPLYVLRVIRDKTIGFLISDPLKKAEFDLLQADKRLNAGIYLFNSAKSGTVQNPTKQNENKMKLAVSTVSKAENYFEQAIGKMGEAKTQGKDTVGIEEKLKNALKKHEQEIAFLVGKASVNFKAGFEKEFKRVTDFAERLNR